MSYHFRAYLLDRVFLRPMLMANIYIYKTSECTYNFKFSVPLVTDRTFIFVRFWNLQNKGFERFSPKSDFNLGLSNQNHLYYFPLWCHLLVCSFQKQQNDFDILLGAAGNHTNEILYCDTIPIVTVASSKDRHKHCLTFWQKRQACSILHLMGNWILCIWYIDLCTK